MVAVWGDVAAELLSQQSSTDDETLGVLLFSLRRSLVREEIGEELYDDLDAVLDEYARPTPDKIGQIAERFRKVTTKLVNVVPHVVTPCPVDEVQRLIDLRTEYPCPENAYGHLARFAITILSLLDLMGDAAP